MNMCGVDLNLLDRIQFVGCPRNVASRTDGFKHTQQVLSNARVSLKDLPSILR